jgi:hypothetical protein
MIRESDDFARAFIVGKGHNPAKAVERQQVGLIRRAALSLTFGEKNDS